MCTRCGLKQLFEPVTGVMGQRPHTACLLPLPPHPPTERRGNENFLHMERKTRKETLVYSQRMISFISNKQDARVTNIFCTWKEKPGGKHLCSLRQCFLHQGGNLHLRNISSGLGKHLFPYKQTFLFAILFLGQCTVKYNICICT